MVINISFEENDNTKFVCVSYSIRSDILVPNIITSELAVQPTHVFAKGDRYLSKTFDPETKTTTEVWRERPWGVWRIDTKGANLSLKVEDHILYLGSPVSGGKPFTTKGHKGTQRILFWFFPS